MALMSLKSYIAEARKADGKYTEEKTKGIVHKVILELEGSDAAQATKLMRRYKNMQTAIGRLEKSKDELNDKLRDMAATSFDEANDAVITRVIATSKFAMTVAKAQAGKEKSEVDYGKILDGIRALVDKDLLPKIEELIEANTRKWVADPPKAALTVKQIEEGVLDAAKGALGTLITKVTAFADKLKAKFRVWGKSYDAKLAELKDEMQAMEAGKPLAEAAEEPYIVIGNPGRSQPSALWPATDKPEPMKKADAEKKAKELNDGQSKTTYGVMPSSVHWHAQPLSACVADDQHYISGTKARNALRDLWDQLRDD